MKYIERKPLYSAINNRDVEMVRLLLEYGANPEEVGYGKTALFYAILRGETEIVRILLQRGVNTDNINGNGLSAHDVALRYNNEEILELLELFDHEKNKYDLWVDQEGQTETYDNMMQWLPIEMLKFPKNNFYVT